MYKLYQAQADLLYPARQLARFGAVLARASDIGEFMPHPCGSSARRATLLAESGLTHSGRITASDPREWVTMLWRDRGSPVSTRRSARC